MNNPHSHTISISRSTSGRPVADPEELSVESGHQIIWNGDADFTIEFDGESPCDDLVLRSSGRRVQASIRPHDARKHYKYSVRIGDALLDPIIIVDK